MEERVSLPAPEVQWLMLHLLEIVEAINNGEPLRASWVFDSVAYVAHLRMLLWPDEPIGGGDPNLN